MYSLISMFIFNGVIVKTQNCINRVFFLYIVMYGYYYRVKENKNKTRQKEKARLNVLGHELNNHISIWVLLLNKEQFYESNTPCSSTGVFNSKTVQVPQRWQGYAHLWPSVNERLEFTWIQFIKFDRFELSNHYYYYRELIYIVVGTACWSFTFALSTTSDKGVWGWVPARTVFNIFCGMWCRI